MKKIFAILLIISTVLSLASCGNNTTTSQTTTQYGNIGGGGSGSSGGSGSGSDAYMPYICFEEYCGRVNTVVKAKIIGIAPYGANYTKFTFKVTDVLYGTAEETINVMVPIGEKSLSDGYGREIHYTDNGVSLIEDNEYLLPLIREEDVYNYISPAYGWQYATIINLDDLSKSEMYNEPLANHLSDIDITTASGEDIVEFVCNLVENNDAPEYVISKAETLKEIIDDSACVFHIRVKEMTMDGNGEIRNIDMWICEIVETLKGDIPSETTEIEVVFFGDTVEAGEEYIVATDDGPLYVFTTKDSLRPVSEKAEIKGYID